MENIIKSKNFVEFDESNIFLSGRVFSMITSLDFRETGPHITRQILKKRKNPFVKNLNTLKGINKEDETIKKLCEIMKIDYSDFQFGIIKRDEKYNFLGHITDGYCEKYNLCIEIKVSDYDDIYPDNIIQIANTFNFYDVRYVIYCKNVRDEYLKIIVFEREHMEELAKLIRNALLKFYKDEYLDEIEINLKYYELLREKTKKLIDEITKIYYDKIKIYLL